MIDKLFMLVNNINDNKITLLYFLLLIIDNTSLISLTPYMLIPNNYFEIFLVCNECFVYND